MKAQYRLESAKAEQRRYSRRTPEGTPFYRIVSSSHEELKRLWEDIFQHHYGVLRDEVTESFERYRTCGILAHGCARACCENPECNHSELIAFSCKTRNLCPSCGAKRAVLFGENVVENVLKPREHRHCVFTLPKRVRPFFKFRRDLHGHLYRAAWESWKELILEQCPAGMPAAVLALHSAGDLLAWHPHAHGLFLAGATLPDGTFQPVNIERERLQDLFADKVLQALRDEGLLSHDDVDNIKSWPHSGFNVFVGEPIAPNDTERLLFAARYLKKCPVSNERLAIIEGDGEATIEYASYKNGVKNVRCFTPLQFLAELQQHIPNTWEQTTRFLGAYSCRSRGAAKARLESSMTVDAGATTEPLPETHPRASASWARCMKRTFEIDPLICPKCGAAMKIKAFITDPKEIDRITKHLGLAHQRAPPKLRYSLPLAA